MVSEKLRPFGTTIFSEMTRLALAHEAINLSQGFPDFEGPQAVREAAVQALREGYNQYPRSQGAPALVEAVAEHHAREYDLHYDPMREVGVYSGATEGLMASTLGLLNPGDEVILFEPVYDSYPACLAMSGAVPRYATLRFPDFEIDFEALGALFNERTRLLLLNTPHNPTGKVFSQQELQKIAELCIQHDVYVVADEVYEHLTFDGVPHVPMASLPGMKARTLSISSMGKSYSFTGWKTGWATGPAPMIQAAQSAHQFLTFGTAHPLQIAAAYALTQLGPEFYEQQRLEYTERRDLLLSVLREVGLRPNHPKGSYFIVAEFDAVFDGDDVAFAKYLTTEIGVAAIPPSNFYPQTPDEGRRLIRLAFCKSMKTLEAAAQRLRKLSS